MPLDLDALAAALERIETKLDVLLECIAEQDESEPEALTLDGTPAGQERAPGTPL